MKASAGMWEEKFSAMRTKKTTSDVSLYFDVSFVCFVINHNCVPGKLTFIEMVTKLSSTK